jgi:hypothetical protein
MNKESLDALLIDHALGALPPDPEALLAAYIVQNPETAADLEQTLNAVGLARNALYEEDSTSLPLFCAPRKARHRQQLRRTLQVSSMAATLAIGLTFGLYLGDTSRNTVPYPIYTSAETVPAPSPESGIWSITPERLIRKPARPARWKWHSPVHQPERINQGDPS